MALHYALSKLKLCNVELKEQQLVVLEHIYNRNNIQRVCLASYRIR